MSKIGSTKLHRALVFSVGFLIVKVTAEVILGYRNYFPPNFRSNFLLGREDYFFGSYRWAFYPHIASGPVSLVLGMILLSESFRRRFAKWHRRLGRIQVANILLLVAPSGLWMAFYAAAGISASIGFAILACLTAASAALGWRAAVQRRFPLHRIWMQRCFLLLCSTVVLRLLGGLAVVSGIRADWYDPLIAWASWLLPLAIFELLRLSKHRRPTRLLSPSRATPSID